MCVTASLAVCRIRAKYRRLAERDLCFKRKIGSSARRRLCMRGSVFCMFDVSVLFPHMDLWQNVRNAGFLMGLLEAAWMNYTIHPPRVSNLLFGSIAAF